jgi:DNA-directed RNA polymerase subunit H (RpoH/RPB5)
MVSVIAMADPLTHEKAPKHSVLSATQARMLLKRLNLETERLPTISIDDAAVSALRGETEVNVGDIIQISRTSISAGEKTYWRLVTEG